MCPAVPQLMQHVKGKLCFLQELGFLFSIHFRMRLLTFYGISHKAIEV